MKKAKMRATLAVLPTVGALAVGSLAFTAGSASAGAPNIASAGTAKTGASTTQSTRSALPLWCIKLTQKEAQLRFRAGLHVSYLTFLSKTERKPASTFVVPCPWPAAQFPFRPTPGARKISHPGGFVYRVIPLRAVSKERLVAGLEGLHLNH